MFQISINSIQKHLSYCQKTKLYQNFNLIVDAARPHNRLTYQRQSISRNLAKKQVCFRIGHFNPSKNLEKLKYKETRMEKRDIFSDDRISRNLISKLSQVQLATISQYNEHLFKPVSHTDRRTLIILSIYGEQHHN